MNKEQLKKLLAEKKITQEVYDEMCNLIDAGKQVSQKELDEVVAKVAQLEDEKRQLEQKNKDADFNKKFAEFKHQLCDEEIIGKTISDAELKEIYTRNKDLKSAVIEAINLWATRELSANDGLNKSAKQFRLNPDLRKKVATLQAKVMNALGVSTITLSHLPSARILVDILVNDNTYNFYQGKMNEIMEEFKFVEVGSGINRTKQLETFVEEEDDENLIPTPTQVANSKAANFSYNNEFTLTDTKFKTYISITDGDYVKYFKSSADLVGFIQNTIGKIKRAIYLYQYMLSVKAYNAVFKLLYAKGVSTAETPTNYRESTKANMLDALGEYKELKELITKQYQPTIFCIEDSNMPYAPTTSEFVYITSLKARTNVEKFVGTSLTGDASTKFAGTLTHIPDTYYNPINRQIEGLNIFTDADSVIHNNMILAIEKNAFVPMYNLNVNWSANFPFGLTQVIGAHFRGNIEIDMTAKCFLFEADALLSDFSVPVSEQTELVAPATEKAPKFKKVKKGK